MRLDTHALLVAEPLVTGEVLVVAYFPLVVEGVLGELTYVFAHVATPQPIDDIQALLVVIFSLELAEKRSVHES